MRHQFAMDCFTEIGLLMVETHAIECAVEIEPDEGDGLASWYVARVWVEGNVHGQKRRWHAITERHPLHKQIVAYATDYCSDELAELWSEWLADHPKEYAKRRASEREHSTLGR